MPFACSALGTLALEAKSLLNAIASEMSLKYNSPRSLCLSRAVTRISTAIQQGNAFCLVNKMIDLQIHYSSNLQIFSLTLSQLSYRSFVKVSNYSIKSKYSMHQITVWSESTEMILGPHFFFRIFTKRQQKDMKQLF